MSMLNTIANAIHIGNSKRQFTNCYRSLRMSNMDKNEYRIQRLRDLVEKAGGPAEFARSRSKADADKPHAVADQGRAQGQDS